MAVDHIDVFAADEQSDRPVDLERWSRLTRAVLADQGVRGPAEVSLLFVDAPAMAALNGDYLQRSGPTDVLAFPIEDDLLAGGRSPDLGGTGPGSEPLAEPLTLVGDVVICPAVAAANAATHGVAEEDEVALLVVHGLLHLLGLDHQEAAEAERMEALERRLLARHHGSAPAPRPAEHDRLPASAPAEPRRPRGGAP